MRAVMQNGDYYTGRTAHDIIEAWRASNRWDDGTPPMSTRDWMAASLKIWRQNGYEVPDSVSGEAAFLTVMQRVGLVRRVYGGPGGLQGLGGGALAYSVEIPADLAQWRAGADRWITEIQDGRAYHVIKTTRGWKVSVGYDRGGPGHTYLDAHGAPSGGMRMEEAPSFTSWNAAIDAAKHNAARYAKA